MEKERAAGGGQKKPLTTAVPYRIGITDNINSDETSSSASSSSSATTYSSLDRISNLVAEVMENILVRLPIKDAARTSVLSRRWRYKWHSMSKLVFGRKSLSQLQPKSPQRNQDNWQKLTRIIDHVLVVHNGPIREFSLVAGLPGEGDIDRWLIHLMRTSLSSLTLWFTHGRHRLSSHLFECQLLDKLILHRCELKLPISFRGFPVLRSLKLCSVSFLHDELGALVAECPCLEQLILLGVEGCRHLEFASPNLVKFFFYGMLDRICFEDNPSLSNVNIGLSHARERYSPKPTWNFDKVFGGVHCIKRLHLEDQSTQFLALNCIPETQSLVFDQLITLHMDINLASLGQILVVFCLFRCSPSLQNLSLKAITDRDGNSGELNFWDSQEPLDYTFHNLSVVEISGLIGVRNEMRFIRFVLANSPLLKTFKVNISPTRRVIDEAQIFKDLLRFQRASMQAQIIYTD